MRTAETIEAQVLTQRIGGGDTTAEGDLVRRYSGQLFRLLLRLTRDTALSEDLHQETFRIVIARLRHRVLSEPGKLPQFIFRTGRNLALDNYRKRLRRGQDAGFPEDFTDPAPGQLESLLCSERAAIVRRLLSEVSPDRYRQILERFYLAGEDKSRICAALGLGDLHFNRVLFRARQRLKDLAVRSALGSIER
jgi:RNA polymerase sigma-70 factor, ECF subfamily